MYIFDQVIILWRRRSSEKAGQIKRKVVRGKKGALTNCSPKRKKRNKKMKTGDKGKTRLSFAMSKLANELWAGVVALVKREGNLCSG